MDERNRHEAAEAWVASAHAYIQLQDGGDPNRTILLDPVMLAQCGDVGGKRVLDLRDEEGLLNAARLRRVAV